MKHIRKGGEPATLRAFRAGATPAWTPNWDGLPGAVKGELHQWLLRDQGWICCYCGCRIETDDSHIEHLLPRSQFPEHALAFHNLLACCQRALRPTEPRHCGMLKADWPDRDAKDRGLMVSPLEPGCERRFRFTGDGHVSPADATDAGAMATIDRLGLDIEQLRACREGAIDGALERAEALTERELRRFLDVLRAPDNDGRFAPFCLPVVQVLAGLVAG